MTAFWVDFTEGKPGCVIARGEASAAQLCLTLGREAERVRPLPYAAVPVLACEDGLHREPMCFSPTTCAGFRSCPKRYACSE